MARLILCVFLVSAVNACPFLNSGLDYDDCVAHHPSALCDTLRKSGGRKLLGAPGFPPLPADDISLKNNGVLLPPLLTVLYENMDFIDIVARYVAGTNADVWGLPPGGTLGKDMCIWSFQTLPPPPGDDGQYHLPPADAAKAVQYCKEANDRFQAEVGQNKNDGAVVFGGCTFGSEVAKDTCKLNLGAELNKTYCDNRTQSSAVHWPQAVTMFRVRPATVSDNAVLKAFLNDWRTQDKFHKTHITWVVEGGTGSSTGSVVGGWGGGGGPGINRKVIPCDAISPKFVYPNYTFAPDALNAAKTRNLLDEAYAEWSSQCSILPIAREPDCTFAYPPAPAPATTTPGPAGSSATTSISTTPATTATPAPPPPPPPSSDSNYPASCANYTANSVRCNSKVTKFGFSDAQAKLNQDLTTVLIACAQAMCNKWPGGGTIAQVEDQIYDCIPKNPPTNCTNGATYMALRSARESCQMAAFLNISNKILANARNASKDPNDVAAAAAAACVKTVQCQTDTVTLYNSVKGKTASCQGFFLSIQSDFPWTGSCNQTKICNDYATLSGTSSPSTLKSTAFRTPVRSLNVLFGALLSLLLVVVVSATN